jgi:hypothetical protein
MTLKKILEIEAENFDRIHLFYEGTHWKAYERSALQWVRSVRGGAVKRRFYKVVDTELAVLGINVAMLDRYLHHPDLPVKVIKRTNGQITIAAPTPTTEESFQHWKSCLQPYIPTISKPQPISPENPIFQKLEAFDATTASPLEALYLIRTLKLHLKILKS